MMPNDPVVGGTALRRVAINSPNFNLQNPTASPNPSWAILQSGVAFFFGLVLSGGTIIGPDYIIDPTGMFFYSGPPAFGSLSQSIVPGAVAITDPVGNAALPGFTTYEQNAGTFYANNMLATQLVVWTAATAAGPYVQSAAGIFFLTGANTFINALVGQKIELSAPTIADFTLEIAGALTADTTADVTGALTAHSTADILAAFKAHTTAEIVGALTADSTADILAAFKAHTTAEIVGALTADTTADITGALTAHNILKLIGIAAPSAVSGDAVVWAETTNGFLKYLASTDGNTYNVGRSVHDTFVPQLVNSATFATVDGASFNVVSGQRYYYRAIVVYNGTQNAGAPILSFAHPNTNTYTSVSANETWSVSGSGPSQTNTDLSFIDVTGPGLTTGRWRYESEGFFQPSANEAWSLSAACSIAADTYTIQAAIVILEPLT